MSVSMFVAWEAATYSFMWEEQHGEEHVNSASCLEGGSSCGAGQQLWAQEETSQ